MNAGYLGLAEDVFNDVVGQAPDFAEGWNKRATVRYFMGNHTGSIEDCARVLELEPRHFGALSGLGMIHVALGDDRAALRWFEQALAVHPYLPGVKENISILRERLRGKAI
jgi:tetratricopeptide (TPR) repeat protein